MKQLSKNLYRTNDGHIYYDLENGLIYQASAIRGEKIITPYKMGDDLRQYQIGYGVKEEKLKDLNIKEFELMHYKTLEAEKRRRDWANFPYWNETKNNFTKKSDFLKYLKDEDKRSIINNCIMYELIDHAHIRFYDSVFNSFDFNFKEPIKNDLINLCCGYNSYDTAQLLIYINNSQNINNLYNNIKLRLNRDLQDDETLFNYLIQACKEYKNELKKLDFNKIDFITVRANFNN